MFQVSLLLRLLISLPIVMMTETGRKLLADSVEDAEEIREQELVKARFTAGQTVYFKKGLRFPGVPGHETMNNSFDSFTDIYVHVAAIGLKQKNTIFESW